MHVSNATVSELNPYFSDQILDRREEPVFTQLVKYLLLQYLNKWPLRGNRLLSLSLKMLTFFWALCFMP
jgi:hypothetical protein